MQADTRIPVTINGSTYGTRAADCLSEMISAGWGHTPGTIDRSACLAYGIPEPLIRPFIDYVRASCELPPARHATT